jgi:predicted MPP superfamily phosphohydrolase
MEARRFRLKAWPVLGIAFMQGFLLLAQWFIDRTWIDFRGLSGPFAFPALQAVLYLLTASFIVAALLGFYFANPLVRLIYKIAAIWLGMLNFFFLAACLSWLAYFAFRLTPLAPHLPQTRPLIAASLFSLALAASLYGLLNARWIRVRRVPVKLPTLPESWRGRTALVISDLHLGNVNGLGFSRRVAALGARLQPDIVFFPGDLFDGSKTDPSLFITPFRRLSPPFGLYFSAGNHDAIGDAALCAAALARAGIRVLANERVTVDGLQIVGVPWGDSNYPIRLRAFLDSLRLAEGQASILLHHAPNRLPIVERAGVSLQLSGHTHGGQLFPFTWLIRRAFGKFTYGLRQFDALQVYTSSGAGTWGPPMRVGTYPELVLLQFE